MYKSRLIIILLLSSFLLVSCGNYNKGPLKGIAVSNIYLYPTVDQNFKVPDQHVNYTIDSAKLDDDILTLNLRFSGGCEEHNFDLIFNGMYKKSLPRQGDLYLKHESNGDMCKKLILLELKYDLSLIIGKTQQATNFSLYSYDEKLKFAKENIHE